MRASCAKASILVFLSLTGCLFLGWKFSGAISEPLLANDQYTQLKSNDLRSGFDFFLEHHKPRSSTIINNIELNSAFRVGIQTHIQVAKSAIALQKTSANTQQYYWQKEDFEALEQNLATFKNSEFRTYQDGFSTQQLFYSHVVDIGLQGSEEAFEKRIHAWMKAYPESIVPYSLLAQYYLDKGWEARGEGYIKDVTQEGAETFQSYLAKGLRVLEIAEKNNIPTDAQFYLTRLSLLRGTFSDADEIQQAFLAGLKKDPHYLPLYELMANILLYRWHGDSDDLRLFAEWSANNASKTTSPDVIYAHIAESTANFLLLDGGNGSMEEFLSYGLDWPRIRSGFLQEGQFHPMTTLRYDLFCRMAVAYDDAPTAKVLFDGLQNTHYRRVWGNEDDYKAAKAWVDKAKNEMLSRDKRLNQK